MGSIDRGGPPKLKTVVVPRQKYPEACVWQPTSNLLVLFKFFVGYSFLVSREIDVFYGDGAPSGPNCTLFSEADRLADALRDRSKVGWSPTPHAPVLGALQRALDPKLWGLGLWLRQLAKRVAIYIYRWKRPRMRRRRLHMSRTDQKQLPGDLRTTNRQDSTDAAAMAASSISRIKKIIFFAP